MAQSLIVAVPYPLVGRNHGRVAMKMEVCCKKMQLRRKFVACSREKFRTKSMHRVSKKREWLSVSFCCACLMIQVFGCATLVMSVGLGGN